MKNTSIETAVGIFVLIGFVCVGYLTIKLGKMEWIGDDHYPVEALFHSVTGLKVGSSVEISGVPVGKVEAITLDPQRLNARVRLKIRKGLTLSEDVIASIKTAGLIGDKFVKLSPGGSENTLKPGDTIVETESALDVEDLLSKYVFGKV